MRINNNNVTLSIHQQVVCERKNGKRFGIASNTETVYSDLVKYEWSTI